MKLLLLLTVIGLSGCSIIMFFAQPYESNNLKVSDTTNTKMVFKCVESIIHNLDQSQKNWSTEVTLQDEQSGIIETGNFPEVNVVGFRLRVHHIKNINKIKIELKASGIYFTDLGVSDGMKALKNNLSECLIIPAPSSN